MVETEQRVIERGKRKVTLSVDSEVVRRAKAALLASGKTMSGVFEEALKEQMTGRWIISVTDGLKKEFGKIPQGSTSEPRPKVPKGFGSAKIIRDLRAAR